MWNRAELKTKAKAFLKKFYWKAFLVAIVIALVTSGGSGNNNNKGANYRLDFDSWNSSSIENNLDQMTDSFAGVGDTVTEGVSRMMPLMWGLIFGFGGLLILFAIAIALGFKIFVGAPLEVGGRSFFYKAALSDDEAHFAHLGMAFRKEHYTNVVWAMFYKNFMNFIFFLLLIIPGIIKHYGYSMVPYLLAENPNLGASQALSLSEEMTKGHKLDMFILDLSFIGWYILGGLLFGLGIYFVNPYVYATKAQLFISLRDNALNQGFYKSKESLSFEEF